jgi:aminoglycoside/choline kinase family phosphotransferase
MSLSPQNDPRFIQLSQWLGSLPSPELKIDTLRPASTDASFRRYFRLDSSDGVSYIAMDAPPPQENVRAFVQVAGLFGKAGASVPELLAQDLDNGFLLISDLGTTMYLHALTPDSAYKLYIDAIDTLVAIQAHSQPGVLPEYDREFLQRELGIFSEWYVGKHLGVTLSDTQAATLNKVFDALVNNIVAQPQVYVHRDYHSRNLMVLPKGNPGVLDFQDARYGPITYDIASLLRDAYIEWDEQVVLDFAVRYWERAKRAGLPVAPDIDSFYRDFEFTGLQRHLKILGIFTRLYHRDGKDGYLNDLPLVMSYVRRAAGRYRELKPLLLLLDQLDNAKPQVGYTF